LLVVQLRVLYETSLGAKATHLLLRIVLPCEAFAGKLRKLPGSYVQNPFFATWVSTNTTGQSCHEMEMVFHENMESCVMGFSWAIKYPPE